jgi:hypothetical protein
LDDQAKYESIFNFKFQKSIKNRVFLGFKSLLGKKLVISGQSLFPFKVSIAKPTPLETLKTSIEIRFCNEFLCFCVLCCGLSMDWTGGVSIIYLTISKKHPATIKICFQEKSPTINGHSLHPNS